MIDRTVILFIGDGDWQVGAIRAGQPIPPRAVQNTIADAIADRPRRVVLGLASRLCMSGSFDNADSSGREGRPEQIYRLEEFVPVAAEEMLADFVPQDGRVLGICSASAHVLRPLAALTELNIAAAVVCPTALLALQHVLASGAIAGRCDVLLWRNGAEIDVFFLSGNNLMAWHLIPDDAGDVARLLFVAMENRTGPLRVAAIGIEPGLLAGLREMDAGWEISAIELPVSLPQAATVMADAIVSGRASALADLRALNAGDASGRGRLSGAVRAVAATFAVMCLALIVAMVIRGFRYHSRAADADDQTRAAFATVFPTAPIPLGIESRLRSMFQSLGAGAPAGPTPAGANDRWLLPLLHQTLANLPEDVRFHVDSLRLEDHQFVIEGQVLSFGDADALAAALRKAPELTVDEPQTERTDSAVTFTLTGSVAGRSLAQGGE